MKKVLLVMAIALIVITAGAQEKESKGMWIGGGFGIEAGDYDSWNISPQWGMLLNENMGIGVNLVVNNDLWLIGPYFRYYLDVAESFKFFGDGGVSIGGYDGSSIFTIGVSPGVQYWFTPKWSMAAKSNVLSYSTVNEVNRFYFGLDATDLSFSLYYHF